MKELAFNLVAGNWRSWDWAPRHLCSLSWKPSPRTLNLQERAQSDPASPGQGQGLQEGASMRGLGLNRAVGRQKLPVEKPP